MSRKYRIIIFSIMTIMFIILGFLIEGSLMDLFNSFWFTSGILLLFVLSLIDQPYFSNESSIFVNSITALTAILILPKEDVGFLFYLILLYVSYLVLSSSILFIIKKESLKQEGPLIRLISKLNSIIGNPKVTFSIYFLWGINSQYTMDSIAFNTLLILWILYLLLTNHRIYNEIAELMESFKPELKEGIGTVFGVQSQHIYLAKVSPKIKELNLFEFVKVNSSVDKKTHYGLITEIMLLDKERWMRVFTNDDINEIFNKKYDNTLKNDIVYIIAEEPESDYIDKFIGLVDEESTINKINFLYNSKTEIFEGDIVEITINKNRIFYQVIQGVTKTEQLSAKNKSDFIIGKAIQLGTWDDLRFQFEKYGWVPEINTPLQLASSVDPPVIEETELILGYLPNTNLPVVMDKELAVTHHMAVVGVTGTGKSVFARNIIREHLKDDAMKVICIDFTGEYKNKFRDLKPIPIIDESYIGSIKQYIEAVEHEESKYPNHRNHDVIKENKKGLADILESSIISFLKSDNDIALFELEDLHNTSNMMYYTMAFIRMLFFVAKKDGNYGKRVCLVLEEAHTIVPEWNFIATHDKHLKALVNSVAQIALQGRKYNIGLLVIAQRTANVSKTILTQCNSIVSFQQFDDTSIDFLANYFGYDISKNLSNLKTRQAMVSGLALKSGVPMMIEIPEINEDIYLNS